MNFVLCYIQLIGSDNVTKKLTWQIINSAVHYRDWLISYSLLVKETTLAITGIFFF